MLFLAPVFGLTSGELFIVVFVTVTVVSAPWWLRLGEAIAIALAGGSDAERQSGNVRSASGRDE